MQSIGTKFHLIMLSGLEEVTVGELYKHELRMLYLVINFANI